MKRTLSVLVILLFAATAIGQTIANDPGVENFHPTKMQKMKCPTEGDYVLNTTGTNLDTTATYNLTAGWQEIWAWCKPVDAGEDSLDLVVWFDIKGPKDFISAATNHGLAFVNADSMKLVTTDSLGGKWKQLAIPAGASQIRARQAGVTGNGVAPAPGNSILLVIKQ